MTTPPSNCTAMIEVYRAHALSRTRCAWEKGRTPRLTSPDLICCMSTLFMVVVVMSESVR